MINNLISASENLAFGILIAVALSAVALIAAQGLNGNKHLSPISYIIALPLCALVSFQMSLLIGAWSLYDVIDNTETVVNFVGAISQELGNIASNIANNVVDISREDINWYIFRRCMWSLLFIAIAVAGMSFFMEQNGGRRRSSMRSERVSSRKSDNVRPSRRRR